jgi:tetratricopeptide (TPR) repeat protein
MAKVSMDLSELKQMETNAELLKDALKTQKELSAEIEKLQGEKLKILENTKNKVVKVIKNVTEEHVLCTKDDHEVYQILQRYQYGMARYLDSPTLADKPKFDADFISQYLFDKEIIEREGSTETTFIGLDEVKSELRKDIEKNMDAKTKKKIEEADKAIINQSDLLEKIDKLTSENKVLSEENYEIIKSYEEANKLIKELYEIKGKYDRIDRIMQDEFKKNKIINEIIKVLKEKK